MGGWTGEARIAEETTPRPQADEDLAPAPLQSPLQLHGVVAGVEDEQGSGPLLGRAAQERPHLLCGHLVGVLGGSEALYIHGGGPALADEVQLCDELVGPACDDRLPSRVARWMVVVS